MNTFNANSEMFVGAPAMILGYGSILLVLFVWSLFWKGLALWHAGRKGQPWWFVILLTVNTIGILDIVYLFFVLKLKSSELFRHPGKK